MTTHPLWDDNYYLSLFRLYLKKPEGVKPLYSRPMVELALSLHIPPQVLHSKMFELARSKSGLCNKLREKYANRRRALAADCRKTENSSGFGDVETFYKGVKIEQTFEHEFLPVAKGSNVTPLTLTVLLDLYFRLVPSTMCSDTEEVVAAARMTGLTADEVTDILLSFTACDPFYHRRHSSPMLPACRSVWRRYGNNPEALAAVAAQMKEYFARQTSRSRKQQTKPKK